VKIKNKGTSSILEIPASPGITTILLKHKHNFILVIPFLFSLLLFLGFTQVNSGARESAQMRNGKEDKPNHGVNYLALLTLDQFSGNLRDTVYTDADKYLELRIDQQMLYVHYRDGRTKEYPVSTGNKFLSKGIESRPGLFAIFLKEELHLSSQFDDAKMYHYMPFNMGIGFHSLAGTGYYGNLGVRPSSHGCIRMRSADAKALFNECQVGTLVLAHRGKTARVVAFAPPGFKNEREYTKDDMNKMLAYNLNSIYEGKYFINPPKRFIIDPSIIPRIGINVGNSDDIPEKQLIPFVLNRFEHEKDWLNAVFSNMTEPLDPDIAARFGFEEDTLASSDIDVNTELVKKYVHNPIGILPYFPPNR